jgi:sugar phosphate isomerase/epimerase
MNTSRHALRAVLSLGAAAVFCALTVQGGQSGIGPSFKGPLGLQLYSLRDSFRTNVPGTLRKVRDFGFTRAELAGTYGRPPSEFKRLLQQHGIRPIAGHWSYELWRDRPEAAIAEAKTLGLKYAGCAWIPHEGEFDEQECRAAIAVFNRAGELARKQGVRFFYHIHGYEFYPHGDGTLFDLMMRETRPRFVTFEMDVFWVVFPAQDPVKLLERYGRRWELMHLKDMRRGLELGSLSGGTDVRNDVALGTGQINLHAVLRAARKAGVKWYFIEDESPLVEQHIPVSLHFLGSVRF